MAEQAKAAMGEDQIEAVADRGYFNGEQIKAFDEAKITSYLPRPKTSNNRAKGLYDKQDFIYEPDDDEYECPAGERLTKRTTTEQDGMILYRYWSSMCGRSSISPYPEPPKPGPPGPHQPIGLQCKFR